MSAYTRKLRRNGIPAPAVEIDGNPVDPSGWRYRNGNWYDEFGVRMSEDNWDVVKAVYEWKKIWSDAKVAAKAAANATTAATHGASTDRGSAPDALYRSSNLNGDGKSGFSAD